MAKRIIVCGIGGGMIGANLPQIGTIGFLVGAAGMALVILAQYID